MARLDSPVMDWDEALLRDLIADELPEGLRLDYKGSLDVSTVKQKAEACKDVSAFANTEGGRIIYGIGERRDDGRHTGIPEKLCRQTDEALPDRLMNVLVDGIMPRCVVFPKRIEAAANGYYLVLDVPPSHVGLHMVTKQNRYYYRSDDDSLPMDEAMVRAGYERFHRVDDRLGQLYARRRSAVDAMPHVGALQLVIVPAFAPHYLFEARCDPQEFDIPIGHPPRHWESERPVWSRSVGEHGFEHRPVVARPERPTRWTRITFDGVYEWYTERPKEHMLLVGRSPDVGGVYAHAQLSGEMYNKLGYHGAVRVYFRVIRAHDTRLDTPHARPSPAPPYPSDYVECSVMSDSASLRSDPNTVVKELMDRLWGEYGEEKCWWFDQNGRLILS